MTATVDEALAWLRAQSEAGTDFGAGWCLRVQRTAWDVPAKYRTAWGSGLAAQAAGDLWPTAPPRGAVCYWSGGTSGAGHVTTCEGGWDVPQWTTDFYRTGRLDLVPLATINRAWSNLQYRGWSHRINDVIVLTEDTEDTEHDEGGGQPLGDEVVMKAGYLCSYSGSVWLVALDLSSKTGIPTPEDLAVLRAATSDGTNLLYKQTTFSDRLMASIPVAS